MAAGDNQLGDRRLVRPEHDHRPAQFWTWYCVLYVGWTLDFIHPVWSATSQPHWRIRSTNAPVPREYIHAASLATSVGQDVGAATRPGTITRVNVAFCPLGGASAECSYGAAVATMKSLAWSSETSHPLQCLSPRLIGRKQSNVPMREPRTLPLRPRAGLTTPQFVWKISATSVHESLFAQRAKNVRYTLHVRFLPSAFRGPARSPLPHRPQ